MTSSEGDAPTIQSSPDLSNAAGAGDLFSIPAGDDIEGDFHIAPDFVPDGSVCWIAHRVTNNITVLDAANAEIKTVLNTGLSPMDIAFSSDYGIVTCYGSDEVQIWDWKTETLVTTLDVFGQPARVEISADNNWALVSTEAVNQGVLINLSDFSMQRIHDFPTGISGFSVITSNTRNLVRFNGFAISPDGSQAVNGAGGPLKVYNLANQTVDSLSGLNNANEVAYTADGSKIITITFGSTPSIRQVDPNSLTVIAEINPTDNVGAFNGELAMSDDGNRIFLPGQNQGILIRFDQNDYQVVTTDAAVFWTDKIEGTDIAVAGGFNTHMVDMQSGRVLSTSSGISLLTGSASPSGDFMVAMDPLRRERVELLAVLGNQNLLNVGHVQLGSELEADATYSVQFTHDGQKLIAVNSLSGSLTKIDVASRSVEQIMALENYEIYHAAITPDDKYAIVGERLADQVSVVNIDDMTIEKIVYGGGNRPDQSFVRPQGDKAFILNAGGTDAIGVIDLTSEPDFVKSYPSGNTGISWTNRGIRCNLAMTPDGSRGVLAVPFDNAIQIIDLDSDAILTSIPTEGFPLQTALSHPIDGRIYAAVTLKNSGQVYIIEDVLNTPLGFGAIDVGNNPTRIAFDPVTERFAVTVQGENMVKYISPLDFAVVGTEDYSPGHAPISIAYTEDGVEALVLQSNIQSQPNQVKFGNEVFDIGIAPGHYFDLSPDGSMMAVVSIHEDLVYLIDRNTSSVHTIKSSSGHDVIAVGPVPCNDVVHFYAQNQLTMLDDITVEIYDGNGSLVSAHVLTGGQDEISVNQLPKAAYWFNFKKEDVIIQSTRVLKQ